MEIVPSWVQLSRTLQQFHGMRQIVRSAVFFIDIGELRQRIQVVGLAAQHFPESLGRLVPLIKIPATSANAEKCPRVIGLIRQVLPVQFQGILEFAQFQIAVGQFVAGTGIIILVWSRSHRFLKIRPRIMGLMLLHVNLAANPVSRTILWVALKMIWAHRDPYKATGSLCSTVQMGHGMLGFVDHEAIGRTSLTQMRAHVERPLRLRERIGDAQFYDLHYANLMRDPIGEMRAIYAWAGEELAPEVEMRMKEWLTARPQDRFGPRPYSLEQYGLTKKQLEPVFAEYLARFEIELEGGE